VPKTATRGGQPQSSTVGGQPLRDTELLAWCGEVIRSVLADLAVGVLSELPAEQAVPDRLSGALMPLEPDIHGCSRRNYQ
jgi:hypothetical protein